MTLSGLRTATRNIIRQISTTNTNFPGDDGLDVFINEGVRYLGSLIEYPRQVFPFAATSNTPNYTINAISNRIISILSAYFGNRTVAGDIRQIAVIKEPMLAGINPAWYETAADNNGRPNKIILLDRDTIWCDPKPDSVYSASGYSFYLLCSTVPVDLSASSDTPNLPLAYHDAVPYHAASIAFFAIKEPDNADACMKLFDKKRKEMESAVVKESDKFLSFSFVGSDPTEFGDFGFGDAILQAESNGGRLIY